MTELAKDVTAIDVTDLLTRYSFDLDGYTVGQVVEAWLQHYPIKWVRLAVIEALYQGRYKAISVEQILNLWKRRGKSLYRFNHEFERIICGRFPGHSTALPRFYQGPSRRSSPRVLHPPSIGSATPPSSPASSSLSQPPSSEATTSPLNSEQPTDTETTPASVSDLPPESIDIEPTSPPTATSASTSSPVPPFQPDDRFAEPLVMISTARSSVHREPIHQFVPASEFSDFYAKLKLVAQEAVSNQDNSPLN
ncbi:hypothetical protein [Thermocoleostomius sinensis]|uniref:DnaD domain protein n=1 Tax=Thermocoleostomius sinensis A174 TaxID=2016057 RepID=A0A9E8ZAG1_9CYAN|nr:hypothetical protein [Thermocoleostomius sinensis]WAL59533.1 hypothetical protein OXH18_20520 [Thermocoleostomius sinensis A174]